MWAMLSTPYFFSNTIQGSMCSLKTSQNINILTRSVNACDVFHADSICIHCPPVQMSKW